MTKIGFIGLGNMGGSLARLVIQKTAAQEQILLANRSLSKAEKIAKEAGGQVSNNPEIFEEADVIFLGVKPAQLADVLKGYAPILEERTSVLFISMAAGVPLSQLESLVPAHHRFIRIMPNTPVTTGAGLISYVLSAQANSQDEAFLKEVLQSAGLLVKVAEEQIDAATAVAGCGPAFVYQFIEALADAGVKNGLTRDLALTLAAQTVLGSAKLLQESGQHPAVLKDQVCSPAGATIAGVTSLEADGFRGSVFKAVDAAHRRTQELGKSK